MTKMLIVQTSPRGEKSVSRALAKTFIHAWRGAYPDGVINERDLAETPLAFVSAPWLQAYFTSPADHTVEMKAALQLSNLLISELVATDHLVISTPVYNYNIPASLKAWFDHVVRKGITLGFDGSGLVTGKKATVIIASGGIYTEGSPIRERDLAAQYLKLILGVLGFTDISFIAGGGAKAVDMGETSMESFVASLATQVKKAALADAIAA